MINRNKPFIINIDGNDGCGKTTIVQKLYENLIIGNFKPKIYKFPSYGLKYAGPAEYIIQNGIQDIDFITYYMTFCIDRRFAFKDIYNDYINNTVNVFIFDRSWVSGVLYTLAMLHCNEDEVYEFSTEDMHRVKFFKNMEFGNSLICHDPIQNQNRINIADNDRARLFFNTSKPTVVNEYNYINIMLCHTSIDKNIEMLNLNNKKLDKIESDNKLFNKVYEISTNKDFLKSIDTDKQIRNTFRIDLEYDDDPSKFKTIDDIMVEVVELMNVTNFTYPFIMKDGDTIEK